MAKESSKKLEQKTEEGNVREELKPLVSYQQVLDICKSIHHGYSSGTSRYSLRERMEIHERRHIPMTF